MCVWYRFRRKSVCVCVCVCAREFWFINVDFAGFATVSHFVVSDVHKDNRLLPLGWVPAGPNTFATVPKLPAPQKQRHLNNIKRAEDGSTIGRHNTNCYDGYDPDYCEAELTRNGQDHIRYRIFLDEVDGWARIEARLYYQTIPPYYLADRFRSGQNDGDYGRDTKRLIHIASRLNLADSAVQNWKMQLGPTAVMKKGEAARKGLSFEQTLERMKIPNVY